MNEVKISDALSAIQNTQSLFISRGDESGTHKRELELWQDSVGVPAGEWYREIGSGMGAALNMASSTDAYTLSDRGTWLSFGNKGKLKMVLSGYEALFNPYGIILVDPKRHPHVKIELARIFSDWIISDEAQSAIAAFNVQNMQLFCPNSPDYEKKDTVCPSTIPNHTQ